MTAPIHPLANKRIIVSGAGIGGLAFVNSFHKLWPSVSSGPPPAITVYERDACAVPANRTGYSLSIRSDSPSVGIQTLQKMGLLDRLMKACIAAMGGENEGGGSHGGFCVWTIQNGSNDEKKWERMVKVVAKNPPGCPVSGLRLHRATLRKTLAEEAEKLPNVKIVWDSAITDIKPSADGDNKVIVTLPNGTSDTADLLVAADGSSSKLRAAIRPNDILKYAGVTCIYGICPIEAGHPSGSSTEFGSVISGARKGLFIAPVDSKKMIWSLSWPTDSPRALAKAPLSATESQAIVDEARKEGVPIFGQTLEKAIQATDLATLTRFNAMDKQPFAHTAGFVQNPALKGLEGKLVFIGDANHAVSPFAGNGANLALADAWALAESLLPQPEAGASTQQQSFEQLAGTAIKKFDDLTVNTAATVIKRSHMNIRIMHCGYWESLFWIPVLKVIRWLFFRKVD